jgi:hypothetical protein
MLTEELKRILNDLPRDFFGDVQIGYQAGHPGVVRVTKTYKLSSVNTSNRDDRGQNVRQLY